MASGWRSCFCGFAEAPAALRQVGASINWCPICYGQVKMAMRDAVNQECRWSVGRWPPSPPAPPVPPPTSPYPGGDSQGKRTGQGQTHLADCLATSKLRITAAKAAALLRILALSCGMQRAQWCQIHRNKTEINDV